VLYRERSGEKNFVSGGIGRPERFRYSDLKEAVVESSSYVFGNPGRVEKAGARESVLPMDVSTGCREVYFRHFSIHRPV